MRRRFIVIALVLTAILVAVSIALQAARTGQLTVTAAGSETVEVAVYQSGGGKQTFELAGGTSKTLSLPKGAARVDATAGKIKSIDVVEIRGWRATTELTAPSGTTQAVQKIGSNAVECPLLKGGRVFSYSCTSEGQVYRHVALDSNRLDPREELFEGRTFSGLMPYLTGLLGFGPESYSELLFVTPDRQTADSVALPEEVLGLLAKTRPQVVVSRQPDDAAFALVFIQVGRVYIFKQLDDANPVRLSLDPAIKLGDPKFIHNFQLYDGSFLIFAGNNDHYEGEADADELEADYQSQEHDKAADQTPQHIFEYDLSGKQTRRVILPGGIAATNGVSKLAGDYYTLQSNEGLNIYRYQDDKLEPIYRMLDVTDILPTKQRTYFVVNGTIYVLEPPSASRLLSLHSVFSSPVLTVSSLINTPGGLIFTAFSDRTESQAVLDIFRLMDDKQTTLPFEEIFPYERLSGIITGYDYDDKQIIFYIRVAGSGGGSYSQLLAGIKDKLKELKMDTGGRSVKIGPLN